MELERIIHILGKKLGKHLLLLRQWKEDPTFRIYKTYTITLLERVNKVNTSIISASLCDKVPEDAKTSFIPKVEEEFILKLFEYYGDCCK